MTIGYVLDDNLDVSDGVQQAVINIAEKMRNRGHDVHYLVVDTERSDLQNIHSLTSQISVKFNGNSVRTPTLVNKSKLTNLFSKIEFDVLHIQMPYSPLFAGKIINFASPDTKIFGTFHILPYDKLTSFSTKVLGYISKRINKKFDNVFAVSQPANEFMFKTYKLKGEVIPNPVDYKLFEKKKSKTITKNRKTTIVFVGRFEKRKGAQKLVEAINLLPKTTLRNIEVVMCGKGPLLDKVQQYANVNKLPIIFPGFVSEDQKVSFLQNADIAVFPSISGESFGIVLAEAMAAGAGITLGGNNPGYSSVLGTWPEALFDPLDINALKNKLEMFIRDLDLRYKIGNSQHKHSKNYDIELVCDRLEDFYGCK